MSLTGIAFVLAYVAGLGLAIFRHPRFGLYTYLAVFYLHPPSRWWGASLPDLRWSLVAALVTLFVTLRLPPRADAASWSGTVPAKLLIAFTVWMWIQNVWALAPPEHLEASVLFTKYIVLYYLIYRLADSTEEVGNVLFVHTIGCGYLGWLAWLAPGAGRLEGVGGPGIDEANVLGMFIATGVLCGAMIFLGEKSWKRWSCALVMPFLLNTIVQSESRGAMLGLISGGLVLMYLRPKAYRKQFLMFGVLGVLLFGYVAQDVFWERMSTLRAAVDDSQEMDSSAESRVALAEAQWRMFLSYPLGSGHRGTAVLSPVYLDQKWLTRSPGQNPDSTGARSSHNTLLSALVEQGVPGAFVYVGFIIWWLRMVSALKRHSRLDAAADSKVLLYGAPAAGCLAAVFVAGMFTDYIKTEVQIWMYAILCALVLIHAPGERHQRSKEARGKNTIDSAIPASRRTQAHGIAARGG